MNEDEIQTLADEALDTAVLHVQTKLGVSNGGYAALYFSDDVSRQMLVMYIRSELRQRGAH